MGVLFIFIFISILIVSALLFFNKGKKAEEIKSILKDIYKNFKELFSNFKKLFFLIKELIQSKLDQEPIQLKDDSSAEESPESASLIESTKLSSKEFESPSKGANNDSIDSKPEVIPDPEVLPTAELETPSEDSNNESIDSKPEVIPDPEVLPTAELETPSEDSNIDNIKDEI